jgi:hypothetical protein
LLLEQEFLDEKARLLLNIKNERNKKPKNGNQAANKKSRPEKWCKPPHISTGRHGRFNRIVNNPKTTIYERKRPL